MPESTKIDNDKHQSDRIKVRILAPVAFALLLITIITIFLIYKYQSERILGQSEVNAAHTHHLIQLFISDKTELLSSLNTSLRRNSDLQRAWLKKDHAHLLKTAQPHFREMLKKYHITHFYFIGLDQRVFLRVHQPNRKGDLIERITLKQAVNTGEMGAGLELGPIGTFTLRVVFPWYVDGKLAGYLELGQEIDKIITQAHKLMGINLILMVKKTLLDQQSWQKTMTNMGRPAHWHQFEDMAIISNTIPESPHLELAAYRTHPENHIRPGDRQLPQIKSIDGRRYSVSFAPLIDAGGNDVGDTFLLSDITDEHAALKNLTYRIILSPVLFSILLFIIFYRYIGSIEMRLLSSREQLINESLARESALAHARDTAEETAKMKSQFLANMSHELRTPMNGVMGMLQLLEDTTLSDEQQKYTRLAYQSAEMLITLINDILDLSKIEASKLELENIPFDIRTTLEELAESLYEIAYKKGLTINCLIDSATPATIYSDPYRLRQILNNLISNAIKFTREGEIKIRIIPDVCSENNYVLRFEVIDSGIGITPDKKDLIFEPFTQADGSTTRHFGGTGLGLAISKRIVQQMGGDIGVISSPGQGSCFYFTIPLERGAITEQAPLYFADIQDTPVLLVNSTASMTEILQLLKLRVIEASDPEQTINLLLKSKSNNETIPIVIFDNKQCNKLFDITKAIKNNPAISNTHLVLLTDFGHRGDANTAHIAGIDAFLTKPIRQKLLYECLASLMGTQPNQKKPLVTKHSLIEYSNSQKELILLAEDDEINQIVVVAMLKKLGYKVDVACNGLQVLSALTAKNYDLIIMDCHMPHLNGYETTQHIRNSNEPWCKIPIIALTANSHQSDKDKCLASGMDEFMTKPVKQDGLASTLSRLISKSQVKQSKR